MIIKRYLALLFIDKRLKLATHIFILFALIHITAFANKNIDVNCYNGFNINNIEILPLNSDFDIYLDGVKTSNLVINSIYNIAIDEDSLLLSLELTPIRKAKNIIIKGFEGCSFKVKSTSPTLNQKVVEQTLSFRSYNCRIQFINTIDIESYVSGVVEAEVGNKQPLEYYKVQATICRTYVLAHLSRHERDGFNVCDKEHCQVFKGKSLGNYDIILATQQTENSVLVDENLNLIVAAFHSNCGGQTISSADVWNKAQPYLIPTRDTFCINSKNAFWEKEINKTIWNRYIKKKFPNLDENDYPRSFSFEQPYRKKEFTAGNIHIPLKDIRSDLGLKSTYFSIEDAGETLVFRGKGYGHGIGLCQEGAIRMAKTGYSYSDIIHFYFRNVTIINLNKLNFFKEAE
jgi:stage II sporulation protein D